MCENESVHVGNKNLQVISERNMQHQNYSWFLPHNTATPGYQSSCTQFQQPSDVSRQPHQMMQFIQPRHPGTCHDGSLLNHHAFNGELTNHHPRNFYDLSSTPSMLNPGQRINQQFENQQPLVLRNGYIQIDDYYPKGYRNTSDFYNQTMNSCDLSRTTSMLNPGQTIDQQRQQCENRQPLNLINRNMQTENYSHKGFRNTSNSWNQTMNICDFNRPATILNPEQTIDYQRQLCEHRRPLISTNGNDNEIENFNHKGYRNTNNPYNQTMSLIGSNNHGVENCLAEQRCNVTVTNKYVKQNSERYVQSDVSSAISRQKNNTITGSHNDESFSVTTNTSNNKQGKAVTQDCCISENSPIDVASKDDRVLLQQWYAQSNSEAKKDNENESSCTKSDNQLHLTEFGDKMDIWTPTGSKAVTSLDRRPDENKNSNINENDSETVPATTDQRRENNGLDGTGIHDVMPDVRATNSKIENPIITISERKRSRHSEETNRGNLKRSRIDSENGISEDMDEHKIKTNIQQSVTHDGGPDTGNGVFLQKRSHFYILFHQKKHLCLSKYRGKYILMREFLHNCFTEKQHKLVFQEKMKQKIPFVSIPVESRNGALNYMMYKGLIKTKQVVNIGMIHVKHANRLYHLFHGEDGCGACIKLYKDRKVMFQTNAPEIDTPSLDASANNAVKATEHVSNATCVKNNENADVNANESICVASTEAVSPNVGKNINFLERKKSATTQILKSPGTDDGYESAVSCAEETGIEMDETCATDSKIANLTSETKDGVNYSGGIMQLFDKVFRFIEVYDEKFLPMADIIKTFEETEIQKSIDNGNINVFKCTSLEAGFLTDFKQFEAVKTGDAIVNGRILLHVCRSPGVYLKQDSPTKVIQGEAG